MREILFRGKTPITGKWIFGTGVLYDSINTWIVSNPSLQPLAFGEKHFTAIPETVGQYTGLTDKNGKKIFEGDILKGYVYPFYNEEKGEFNYFAEIVWFENSPAFGYEVHKFPASKVKGISVGDTDYLEDFYPNCWEVIGNIHDNPEFMGGDTND